MTLSLLIVLDPLFKSEVLGLADLLNLGATCKAFHSKLRTGQLPAYLEYVLQGAKSHAAAKKV